MKTGNLLLREGSVPEQERRIPEHEQSGHEQYEALCALAAGGLLEHTEFAEFQAHMMECTDCRSAYKELSRLVTMELPQADRPLRQKMAAMRAKPLPYARQRFLRRARAEGLVFSPEVETATAWRPWYFRPVAVLAPVAALVLLAVGLEGYHFRQTPDTAQTKDTAATEHIAELERENSALSANLSRLNESLLADQREMKNLRAQVANENPRRNGDPAQGEAERSSSRGVQLLNEAPNQEKLLADARDEAARNNQVRVNDEATIVDQLARITELTNKLRIASATLDQERQLAAAGSDIRELMASRQLHVIDVRDTDPNGNPSSAFGRVFLTEGKSLTFYAFDLNEDRVVNAKRTFQVWALPETTKSSARSLGFLRADAKAPGRWVLKVENPELVKAISSVFVTVEPTAGGKQPSGQKMLFAYLGEANHP
jgi:hypothetical protein